VNGYCDSIGDAEYNLKLSQRRAEAVVDYLEKEGVAADKLVAHGYTARLTLSLPTKPRKAVRRTGEWS
jgi:outer membrane protein OmpA-like peptidoglycan-associated protein